METVKIEKDIKLVREGDKVIGMIHKKKFYDMAAIYQNLHLHNALHFFWKIERNRHGAI
jgi:hypothetical protein